MSRPRPQLRPFASLALAATALPLLALLPACGPTPEVASRQPPEVTVTRPEVETVTEYLSYDGNLEAVDTAEIRARVPGFLEQVAFTEATRVKKGDLLFVIEPRPYEVAVMQAESSLTRAEAEANAARVRRDLVKDAFDNGAATELEMVEADANVAVKQAAIDQAAALLEDAKLRLSYTQVRSPFDGRIDRSYVDVGNLVGEGERTLLATVVSSDRMYVFFEASERVVLRYVARGNDGTVGEPGTEAPPVEVGRLVDEGYPFVGRVDYADTVVDRNTGTLTVRAILDNASNQLLPGLFARIRVPFQQIEDAILVEENAILTGLDGRYVLVVGPENVVERRPVEVGDRYGTRLLIRSGLAADERYILRGVQRARPGLPVRPTDASSPPAEAPAPAGG
jgi:RND family efflux transporter MFP subunit